MSILSKQTVDETVVAIRSQNSNMFNVLRDGFETLFNSVWNNPNFTPQEIFNQFGSDAAGLFIAAGKTAELLMAINPAYVPPTPPQKFTINADGTVTVTL